MPDVGLFGVRWGSRIDLVRLLRQRVAKAEIHGALFGACAAARPADTIWGLMWELDNQESGGLSDGQGAGLDLWKEPWLVREEGCPVLLEARMADGVESYTGVSGVRGGGLENEFFGPDDELKISPTVRFDELLLSQAHPLAVTTGRGRW